MKQREAITVHLSAPWTVEGQAVRAPAALLTEGEHCGSNGCHFYSADLLRQTAHRWEGIPVSLNHPMDSGGPISIQDAPEERIGHLENARFERGALRAEVVITSARHHGPVQQIHEISTGLFPSGGYRVTDLQPDHLALLLGERGACSWADGCGIRANAEHQAAVLAANAMLQQAGAKPMKTSVSNNRSVLYEHGDRTPGRTPDPMLPPGTEGREAEPDFHSPAPARPGANQNPEPLLPLAVQQEQRGRKESGPDHGPDPLLPTGQN
jgi:hypothetical protein